MDDDVVVLKLEGGKANAMTPELLDTLERMIDGFERSPAAAAVLTGYDRYFSGGLALTHIIDFDIVAMRGFIEQFSRTMTRVFACTKPIVAAVNGHAIAGGCVLALMCDWRIAVDDPAIRIGLNETQLGIGMPAIVIESLRLAVPPASIVPIAFEGTLFTPAQAREVGLVHELAPEADLLARAMARAQSFAELPQPAVAQVKRALRAPSLETIARIADQETGRWLETWFSPEAQARLRAAVAQLGGAVGRAAQPTTSVADLIRPSHSVSQPLPRFKRGTRDPK
jgi:enoyl-CoA hydratase